jgi:hypothetical protein
MPPYSVPVTDHAREQAVNTDKDQRRRGSS